MYRRIAYLSSAKPGLTSLDIDELLADARRFNAHVGVTGVLLYDGSRFFQFLEGSQYATGEAMTRITASRRHHQLRVLTDDTSVSREFDRWYMGFAHATGSFLQRLENLTWQQAYYHKRLQTSASPALQALNDFLDTTSMSTCSHRAGATPGNLDD